MENVAFCTKERMQVQLNIKSMLVIFLLAVQALFQTKFVPPGQMVNQYYYWVV